MAFAASGGAVFIRGMPTEEGMRASPEGHLRALDPAHAASTPTRQGEWGDEWPAITARALRCERGRPVIALRWDGGRATLDPAAPGSAFRWEEWLSPEELPGLSADGRAAQVPPLAWTGRVLVGVTGGETLRWRCGARGSLERAP